MSRRSLFVTFMTVSILLVVTSVGTFMFFHPYTYLVWTVNRQTGEQQFHAVTVWFWSENHSDPGDLVDLSAYGELSAPDVTLTARRQIRQRYPWSEYDDDGPEDIFEPGMTYYEASGALFHADRFLVDQAAKKQLIELRKVRLEIWNSPRIEAEGAALIDKIQKENFAISNPR